MPRWLKRAAGLRVPALVALAAIACSAAVASSRPEPRSDAPRSSRSASARTVRILLAEGQQQVRLSSVGPWEIFAEDGRTPVALTQPGERWILERDGKSVRAKREDSRPVSARETTVIARPADERSRISFNGRTYRGDIAIIASGAAMLVINRLPMDDYLKGVVPQEIGTTSSGDIAAVEAQAVTARSYSMAHLSNAGRFYDMRATVADQVYGGSSAETSVGNAAVESTAGLVLMYDGRVVNAPYYSTCGGSTAEPQDSWRASPEPYLQRVSDQIPGTTQFYCGAAPRFRWTRTYSREALRENVAKYMRGLAGGGRGPVSTVRNVTVTDVTPAGRVAILTVETDRGPLALHGDEMRNALRLPSGELLYSTYFSVDVVPGRDGVESLTLRGGGNGHGVGMCQAGAIGRARAGQDFRTILRTYYPGTAVGSID